MDNKSLKELENDSVKLVKNKYNEVSSFSKKLTKFVINMDTTSLLVSLIIIGFIAVIIGSMKASVINSQIIIIVLISGIVMYIYFKKQYSNKIKVLKLKNNVLKNDSILDKICEQKKLKNKDVCNKYNDAKKNFYMISNMLLQQYKIRE